MNVHVVGAEDCDRVGGDAGGRDLGEADHAAIAGEQHHREREQAPDERIGADLGDEELRRNGGIKKQCGRQRDLARGRTGPGRPRPAAADRGRGWEGRRTRRSHDALRTQRQRDDHDDERQHDAVGRQVDEADLLGQADQQRPDGGSGDGSHAADDHDHERGEQIAHVLAGRERERRAADHAGEAGEPGADREHDGEDHVHVDPRCRQHRAVIDAGADHHADARAADHQPQPDADDDGRAEHDQAVERIGHHHRGAVRAHRGHDRQLDGAVEQAGTPIW